MSKARFVPLDFPQYSEEAQRARAREFADLLARRRSVRMFSDRSLPEGILEDVIRTAASAPSGANKQPWKFVLVDDPALKRAIRVAAEEEEKRNYGGRMPADWLKDLEPFGTDWHKEFLETVPALIVVFKQKFGMSGGRRTKLYYVDESVGIACGLLIAAIHNAGLACLTHTPSPMNFLSRLLGRPPEEVPYLLIPVGYPAPDAVVPDIRRKSLDEVLIVNPAPAGAGNG